MTLHTHTTVWYFVTLLYSFLYTSLLISDLKKFMKQNFNFIKFKLAEIQKEVQENKCHCTTSVSAHTVTEEDMFDKFPLATIEDLEEVELLLKKQILQM